MVLTEWFLHLVRAVHADGQGEPLTGQGACTVTHGGEGGEQEGNGLQIFLAAEAETAADAGEQGDEE